MTTCIDTPVQQAHPAPPNGVQWKQVGLFVGTTFALSWLLDLVLWLTQGYRSPAAVPVLQLQMLLPACCALVLQRYVFRNSPIHRDHYQGRARWLVGFYLAFVAVYVLIACVSMVKPEITGALSQVGLLLMVVGVILAAVVRRVIGREESERVGLLWGPFRYWLWGTLGLIALYSAGAALDAAFDLGHPPSNNLASQSSLSPTAFVVLALVQSVFLNSLLGLVVAFGEEYGWRGYLQDELIKLGRIKGVLLLGVIWGIWHAPVILMGHNYPGHPITGVGLMIVYCVGLAFILGHAKLVSGGIWLAAFMHAVNNSMGAFLGAVAYAPSDAVYSFSAYGLYGLPILLVIAALLTRHPVWRQTPAHDTAE